jgi:hypothetical protein
MDFQKSPSQFPAQSHGKALAVSGFYPILHRYFLAEQI